MLEYLFCEFLKLSEELRSEYPTSLGIAEANWSDTFTSLGKSEIPELIKVIYSNVQGTERNIKDQKLMDFIPGFRLIKIDEFPSEKDRLDTLVNNKEQRVLPLLTNYSSDYICYVVNQNQTGEICTILKDELELKVMFRSSLDFLRTINEFYRQKVYFLDEDGYLD